MIRLALAVALFASASVFAAHMTLDKTFPADKATITTSPQQIQLWFSAAPTLAVSNITVTGPSGKVELGKLALGKSGDAPDRSLVAEIKGTLAAGKHTVAWRTSGNDGHILTGSFEFTFKSP